MRLVFSILFCAYETENSLNSNGIIAPLIVSVIVDTLKANPKYPCSTDPDTCCKTQRSNMFIDTTLTYSRING